MGLNDTPSGERVRIGFFGVRNAGKSSLVNAVCGQQVALVSDVAGTTTDPVRKAMELLPLGPVDIVDTPGIDDVGELGARRVERTRETLRSCDVAVKCKTRYGNNIIACRWDTHKVMLFDVKIEVRGVDSQGVLYAIADVLHKLTHFTVKRITLDTNDGIFDGQLTISVYDTNDVESICNQLKQIENVTEAVRV